MNQVVIFGAGKYAKRTYEIEICRRGKDGVAYFVVSNKNGNMETLLGKNVYSFEEKKNDLRNREIIVAISENGSREVWELLIKNGLAERARQVTATEYDEYLLEKSRLLEGRSIIDKRVVVSCFFGQGYADNCKYVISELLRKKIDLEIIWILCELNGKVLSGFPEGIDFVEIGTAEYYEALATAHIFITNNMPDASIKKKPGQVIINTWHGIGPFKTVGLDIKYNKNNSDENEFYVNKQSLCDVMVAGSEDCVRMFRESMNFEGEILKAGYPRNDIFFCDNNCIEDIKQKVGIPVDKKVVLYAPTFRDIYVGKECSFLIYDLVFPTIMNALIKRFGNEFVLLYRFHHDLCQYRQVFEYENYGINVSDYTDVQELLLISDVLITDYSSIMWDFSLMMKPVFLYHNDVDIYGKLRGFYENPDSWPFPSGRTTDELATQIELFDDVSYKNDVNRFLKKYGSLDDGKATDRVVERIIKALS